MRWWGLHQELWDGSWGIIRYHMTKVKPLGFGWLDLMASYNSCLNSWVKITGKWRILPLGSAWWYYIKSSRNSCLILNVFPQDTWREKKPKLSLLTNCFIISKHSTWESTGCVLGRSSDCQVWADPWATLYPTNLPRSFDAQTTWFSLRCFDSRLLV